MVVLNTLVVAMPSKKVGEGRWPYHEKVWSIREWATIQHKGHHSM